MTLTDRIAQNRNYQFWLLQLIGWTGWVTLFSLRDAYWGHAFENSGLLIADATVGVILTTLLRQVYRLVWHSNIITRVATILVASYLAAGIWQPFKNSLQFYYHGNFKLVEEFGFTAYFNGIIGYSYFLLLFWSGLYFGIKFYQLLQEETQRTIQAESRAHQSQLRMLRYQLNPHFLFNTLNAVSTLILAREPDAANAVLGKLSHFLRSSIDDDPVQKVRLDREIATTKLYLDIEKVRFAERLKIDVQVDDDAAGALIPNLILQPLVENSIKYAIAAKEDGGTINIHGAIEANHLVLSVRDDGPGMQLDSAGAPQATGVGLNNTLERLQELYGDAASCTFANRDPGVEIGIRLPLEFETANA